MRRALVWIWILAVGGGLATIPNWKEAVQEGGFLYEYVPKKVVVRYETVYKDREVVKWKETHLDLLEVRKVSDDKYNLLFLLDGRWEIRPLNSESIEVIRHR